MGTAWKARPECRGNRRRTATVSRVKGRVTPTGVRVGSRKAAGLHAQGWSSGAEAPCRGREGTPDPGESWEWAGPHRMAVRLMRPDCGVPLLRPRGPSACGGRVCIEWNFIIFLKEAPPHKTNIRPTRIHPCPLAGLLIEFFADKTQKIKRNRTTEQEQAERRESDGSETGGPAGLPPSSWHGPALSVENAAYRNAV